MKKRLTAVLLALTLTVPLTGCAWMPDNLDDLPIPGFGSKTADETAEETLTTESEEPSSELSAVQAEPTSALHGGSPVPSSGLGTNGTIRPADKPVQPEPTNQNEGTPAPAPQTTPETPAAPSTKPAEQPAPAAAPAPETEVSSDGKIHVNSLSLDKYTVKIEVGLSDMPWVTMLPSNADNKAELWNSSDTNIAIVDQYGRITGIKEGSCTVTVASQDNPACKAEVAVTVIANKDSSEVTYINGILVANKTYGLPSTYNPGVNPEAQAALDRLIAGGAADGLEFFIRSGFRSYDTQLYLYNTYVGRDGQAEADRYSARPGHSEHQTGLAFDMNSLDSDFGDTAEGIWLAEHCWEYGFIIRYAADKEEITGYMYEPWHIRYVGKEVAKALHESGQCLEEYLGIVSMYME